MDTDDFEGNESKEKECEDKLSTVDDQPTGDGEKPGTESEADEENMEEKDGSDAQEDGEIPNVSAWDWRHHLTPVNVTFQQIGCVVCKVKRNEKS